MPAEPIKIEARSVLYFSQGDESAFFQWLNDIPCVTTIEGRGDVLNIWVDCELLDDESRRELFALFRRYSVDMGQLARLENNDDRA
jgi:hypothetical protein